MKKVITYGVFDYLHLGHVRLFKNIHTAIQDDIHLSVGVHGDNFIKITKPDANIFYSESERVEMLLELKCIDNVFIYDFIDTDLPKRTFDILVVGPDQTNEHFKKAIEYCRKHSKSVVIIPRTENICSSQIKTKIFNDVQKVKQ
ncbi:MAG: adenylyltransferase/cytidyltransferase family protein [Alphaproteobacteria bacterium]|nr:adenylyltransferase/cytidyltransferase family protein [Alphaproteobacteria bacterium]